ncbi:hypothetical protein AB0O99_03950 [Cellulosimicrobium funkei]|uniref:hypothetical protein n=1 Tax=Cellulosimicrobium funkei TaxID=264251 RepID=UPI00341CFD89
MPTPDTIQGIPLADYDDPPAIPDDLRTLFYALMARAIPRFSTTAQRDTAYPVPVDGQRCTTGAGAGLREWIGLDGKWTSPPSVRSRYRVVTASGTVPYVASPTNYVDIAAPQVVPANPLGPGVPYQLRVSASIRGSIPQGLGGLLELVYDDTVFDADRFTNSGTSGCTYTYKASNVVYVNAAAAQNPHTVRARISSLAGNTSVSAENGFFHIEAQPWAEL